MPSTSQGDQQRASRTLAAAAAQQQRAGQGEEQGYQESVSRHAHINNSPSMANSPSTIARA